MTRLRDAHVLVTGGSSGIGLATARAASAKGARVSLIARDPARLADAVRAIGRPVATAEADVTDASAVEAATKRLVGEHGPVDVLMTAAGSAHPGYFEQLDDVVFREQMELDYFGTLHAVRAVVGSMLERRRGHLVLVSSTVGLVGVFGYGAYAPAKYAVRGLAETLRAEYTHQGIVVACVYPPDTRTPGLEHENRFKPPETVRVSGSIRPLEPEQVARAVVRGIELNRLAITADRQTAALRLVGALAAPYVRWSCDRLTRPSPSTPSPEEPA